MANKPKIRAYISFVREYYGFPPISMPTTPRKYVRVHSLTKSRVRHIAVCVKKWTWGGYHFRPIVRMDIPVGK